VWWLLGGLLVASAEAQEIRAVEFRGLTALSEETLRYYLGLEIGASLDPAQLNRKVHDLWERGLIDDLVIEKREVEGGVALIVKVQERPILRSIEYRGMKKVSRTEVGEKISKDQIEVREGLPLNLAELKRLEAAIEQLYRDKGFRFAEVGLTLEEVSPTERRAVFTVDEAERVRIGKIDFEGNRVIGDWRLRWTMRKTKSTNLLWRALRKDIFNPASIAEDLGKVRELYRSRGYKDVQVGEPKLSVVGQGGKRKLRLDIPVVEGERWKLGEITIEGNNFFSDEVLLRQFKRPRGGWLRSKVIEDGVKAIDEAYRNTGHIFARVETELRERENRIADLLVKIQEGDQYRVGRLEFTGNTRTRDKVLRREFRVHEGMVLNMGGLKNSIYKINQLGYFKLDEDDPIQFENFDSEKKTVDLVVKGKEADRTELQIGGGWSELDGFFGQVSVKTQNFLGRGESLGVAFQSGRYRDEFDVSYSVPWLLDRPQSLGIEVFNSDLDYTFLSDQQVVRKSKGGVLTYGRSFGLFHTVSLSVNRSDILDSRSTFNLEGKLVQQQFSLANASIRPAWIYESRDSRVEPTMGSRLGVSLEYAGGPLGGDNYFWRPEIQASHFKTVTWVPVKTVFGANLRAGYVRPFGNRPLSFLERYYLGGETSIRGFRFRSIWVRCLGGEPYPNRPDEPCRKNETLVDEFGFPVGGDKLFQLNLEYHILVGGPFRLVAFLDAGNVYGDSQIIDLGRLRYSAGLEMRIFVPVFGAPLRFIYASNLRPLPDDRFEGFQFSIGATF
jgi:outer membrane protein insertion porin family